MRYAIYVTFDSEAEALLYVWQKRLAHEIAGLPTMAGKMPPHLTLLVFETTNEAGIIDRFQQISSHASSIVLMFGEIGTFTGRQHVIYAKPAACIFLQEHYLRCRETLADTSIVPSYREIAHWKPHVTLAKRIDKSNFERVKPSAEQDWKSIEAKTQTIGLIRVQNPLDVLAFRILL